MAKLVVFSLFGILGFHFISSIYSWYDQIFWLDIPMHLIGGMWVALLFIYLFEKNMHDLRRVHFLKALVLCLGFVALIGILWEFYEYLADVYIFKIHPLFEVTNPKNYPDTLTDIVNDLVGGFLSLSLVYALRRRESTQIQNSVNIAPVDKWGQQAPIK